jgi:hypothetical protein
MSFREIAAFFIKDQCLFGAYPTQHQIHELEDWGVNLIVNLTSRYEKNIRTYSTFVKTINFVILDNKAPENILEFCALIIHITKLIDQNQKIYIHCKGGHGRSGVLVASILCYKYRIMPHEAIQLTTKYHSTRPIHARRPKMNEYWKSKGSPQTKEQKQFVVLLFQPYVITKNSPFNQKEIWIRNNSSHLYQVSVVWTSGPKKCNFINSSPYQFLRTQSDDRNAITLSQRPLNVSPDFINETQNDTTFLYRPLEDWQEPLSMIDFSLNYSRLFELPNQPSPQKVEFGSWKLQTATTSSVGSSTNSGVLMSFNDFIDSFLLTTNLGPINGNNSNELEEYRDSLIENLFHSSLG